MKRINLIESCVLAVAVFAVVFSISAYLQLYHLTQAGLINWKQ